MPKGRGRYSKMGEKAACRRVMRTGPITSYFSLSLPYSFSCRFLFLDPVIGDARYICLGQDRAHVLIRHVTYDV